MVKPDEEVRVDDDGPDDLTASVGENLRRQRLRRGLSLERLAQVSGVSRSMLGQIELGQSTPTIKTLWRIAGALKLPFAALISDGGRSGTRLISLAESKTLTSQDGVFSSRALFPFDAERKVEFYELRLGPRGVERADAHAPGTRENLVVVEGGLELSVRDEHHRLSKGDSIVFDADAPHVYQNPGDVPTLMYLVMTYAQEVG
jgi:transcriptional regulator with XRE-family HTH domain